jgi:hypothetical protein
LCHRKWKFELSICSPAKIECIEESVEHVEQTGFDITGTIGAKCACLPACTEYKFPFSMTQSELSIAKELKLRKELKEIMPNLTDDTYVKENIAMLHIYHENLHFIKHERAELFSIVDLLSYIGGVLGLCLGFSAMSCLECMYFFTVRFGLNVRMNRDEPDVSGGLFGNH